MSTIDSPGNFSSENFNSVLWLQIRLMFYQENIDVFRSLSLNVGYPVLALVFGQIEYLAHMLYSEGQRTPATLFAGRFITEEMGTVNPIYGWEFSQKHSLPIGTASNFGELMYLTIRSKLHHQGGLYPPFKVTAEAKYEPCHLRSDGEGNIIIHAYIMNDELQASISNLYESIMSGRRKMEALSQTKEVQK